MLEWIAMNKEWLFSGVGVAVAAAIFSVMIQRLRKASQYPPPSNAKRSRESHLGNSSATSRNVVMIGDGNVIGGHVAGRDVIMNMDQIKPRLEELVDILTDRARLIEENLSGHFRYAKVRDYLHRFRELHELHIEALRKGNVAHAHEILAEIHKISYELEKDEFWSRDAVESPDVSYSLRDDAFTRGYMICGYVVGDMESYSDKYPTSMVERLPPDHPLRDPLREYAIILGEVPPEPDEKEVMEALMCGPQ